MYRDWVRGIEELSGRPVPVLRSGMLEVVFDDTEMAELVSGPAAQWKAAGFEVVDVSGEAIRQMEPGLSDSIAGGVLLPDEDSLEAKVLMAAAKAAVERDPKIIVRAGSNVTAVNAAARGVEISLENGDTMLAEHCVISAGAWSEKFLSVPPGSVFPHKGQVIEYRVPDATGYPMNHHVYGKPKFDGVPLTAYFAPRSDGRVTVGVTYEKDIWDRTPDAAGRELIARAAESIYPAVSAWTLTDHWGGIRPAAADGWPLIGHLDQHHRVIAATGHFGAGLTLAPLTAALVAALLSGERLSQDDAEALRRCDPHRFAAAST